MRSLPRLVAGATVLGLALLAASPALAGPKTGRVYDCYFYDGSSLQYQHSIKLDSKTTYHVGFDHKGRKLKGKTSKGRYYSKGNRLRFRSGAFKRYRATYHRATKRGPAYLEVFSLKTGNSLEECDVQK